MNLKQKNITIKTKQGIFKVILKSWEGEKGYCVRVPNLPEIVTGGDTIIEAKKMAREAIDFCLECRHNEHYTHITRKRNNRVTA